MKKLILLIITLALLVGYTCYTKDPHDYVPGWQDNTLEFGESYIVLIFCNVDGNCFVNYNTSPGWHGTPDGSYIDYVVMCK